MGPVYDIPKQVSHFVNIDFRFVIIKNKPIFPQLIWTAHSQVANDCEATQQKINEQANISKMAKNWF